MPKLCQEKSQDILVSEIVSPELLKKKVPVPYGEEILPTFSDISPPKL